MAPPRQKVATVNRLMAVLDTAEAATTATRELASAGFEPEAITVLQGDEDADRIDSLGNVHGRWRRVWRLLQFTQADQMVDLVVYEAALRDGRTVIAVHAPRMKDRDDSTGESWLRLRVRVPGVRGEWSGAGRGTRRSTTRPAG